MNDNFTASRTSVAKAPKSGLLSTVVALPNDQAINTLFLNVLSRYPTSTEMSQAMASLSGTGAARNPQLENLLWSLYNKVDFVFNY
jgi:hypothetical protein